MLKNFDTKGALTTGAIVMVTLIAFHYLIMPMIEKKKAERTSLSA